LFIAPFVLDSNDPNTMLAGGLRLWRNQDVRYSNSWSAVKPPPSDASLISAIAVSRSDSNVVWVGHTGGAIYRSNHALSSSTQWTKVDLAGGMNRTVTRLAPDPLKIATAYSTFGGFKPDNVWKTTDGGASWQEASDSGSTSLPAATVYSPVVYPACS